MKKYLFFYLLFCGCFKAFSQIEKPIKVLPTAIIKNTLQKTGLESGYNVSRSEALANGFTINLPTPDGEDLKLSPIESPVMSIELSKKFPSIKTYRLYSSNKKSEVSGVLTISPEGINALIFTNQGNILISPANLAEDKYFVFYQNDTDLKESCEIGDEHIRNFGNNNRIKSIQDFSNGTTLRSYRMAIVTTGEVYTNNGSTVAAAQAVVVSMVNSLRAVYEKEVAVTFTLVATKIYDNPTTDPFNGSSASSAALAFGALSTSEPANFALNLYDIGHVIHHSPGGGGVAYLNGPCKNFNVSSGTSPIKAGGWSGGTTTTLGTFIHEVGHQFSAGHTFNSVNSGCSGNIMTSSAFEPGSGSTYMSYWGNCSPDNISGSVNRTYFHANSLESIISFSASSTCSVNTSTGNNVPVMNVNPNGNTLIIPKGTPFRLEGSGADADGETILFNWEQYNLGTTRGGADEAQGSTDSPIFRSFVPSTTGNIREFPTLSSILAGSIASNDEALPQVARTLTFRLTGRDGRTTGGGSESKTLTLTVDNSGPFLITSQNSSALWIVGRTANINWSVNNTNVAPINCANVKISFSTDGGQTFPYILIASTPNDGSHTITVPNLLTTQGRIKVEAIGNIFFDINNFSITVSNSCLSGVSEILPSNDITATEGDASLNLSLFGVGANITSKSGSLTTTDPATKLSALNISTNTCTNFSNPTYFDIYPFKVISTGNYTFTRTVGATYVIMNFYNGTHSPNSVCSNWIGSSASYNGSSVSVANTITLTLTPGVYYMVVAGFNATTPTYPASYAITFSSGVYENIPTTPYSYSKIIVKNGTIVAVDVITNLSNSTNYPSGEYTIYGVSHGDGADFSTYVGGSFTVLQSAIGTGAICATISTNSKAVTIQSPCPTTLTLINNATPSQNITSGTLTKQAALSNGSIIASNFITGVNTRATYQAKNIQLNAGFKAENGVVFLAEIGGCN